MPGSPTPNPLQMQQKPGVSGVPGLSAKPRFASGRSRLRSGSTSNRGLNPGLDRGGRGVVQLGRHAEAAEQIGIAIGLRILGGRRIITDENGMGASHKTQRL